MTTVVEIEKAIEQLPRDQFSQLRQWIEDYELEQELVASSTQFAELLDEEDGGESQLLEERIAAKSGKPISATQAKSGPCW